MQHAFSMHAIQLSLLGHEEPALSADFSRSRYTQLDSRSFVEYVPEFVLGHAALFDRLQEQTRWHCDERVMYERTVAVPRLTASLPRDGALPPVLAEASARVGERYSVQLDAITLALYRDGRDSVAWHRDHIKNREQSLVAIISLGEARRFRLRPFGGGATREWSFGHGDLLVMGGGCQAGWEHSIPKTRHAYPRMSVMLRNRASLLD
jgi:alkylated DNA repair dioxygenase AlkB